MCSWDFIPVAPNAILRALEVLMPSGTTVARERDQPLQRLIYRAPSTVLFIYLKRLNTKASPVVIACRVKGDGAFPTMCPGCSS
jgi:hypothetical protein